MYRTSKFITLVALALLAGCNDSTGTSDEPLTGTWSYSVANLTSGSLQCAFTGVTLTLDQNGNTFTGSTSGGTITCAGQSESLSSVAVRSGTISGNQVTFTIGEGDNVRNSGTLSGNTITGTALFGSASGTFTMTRQ